MLLAALGLLIAYTLSGWPSISICLLVACIALIRRHMRG
jgi:hypothetical protein